MEILDLSNRMPWNLWKQYEYIDECLRCCKTLDWINTLKCTRVAKEGRLTAEEIKAQKVEFKGCQNACT